MQVYTATPKEKQDTSTINQLRASSREQNSKMKELNEKLKRYEEKHGKLECKYSSDHSDSETDDDHFWKLQSPAEDTSLQESSKTKVQTHTIQIGAINTKTDTRELLGNCLQLQQSNANTFLSHLTEQPKRCSLGGGWVLFKHTCHIALQEACFMRCRRGRAAAVNINLSLIHI